MLDPHPKPFCLPTEQFARIESLGYILLLIRTLNPRCRFRYDFPDRGQQSSSRNVRT